ncbi:MAG TPA: putative toxin-antitoxin system toxin component, PIN family [Thermoanaerobaculia bacterium]|nr:putative toxin-antitoxin system toxin component, PIN family [Thermoanaerobaculia bacterium]
MSRQVWRCRCGCRERPYPPCLRREEVFPTVSVEACRDPKDNKVLEAALAGKADVIVTGDDDLFMLNPFEGIQILGPAAFLNRLV